MARGPGRPKELNTKTINRAARLIAEGCSLTECARKLGIARQTIYNWKKSDETFAAVLEEALHMRAHFMAEDTLEIADDESKDLLIDPETGQQYANNAAVARAKIRIQTRQKLMRYFHPERYGENQKIDVTTNGENIYGGLVITPPKEDDEDVD